MIDGLINNFNDSDVDKVNKSKIFEDFLTIFLTNTFEENKNDNKNETTIHLNECENILKDFYYINYVEPLYIIKVIVKIEGMKIPKVEYEVYYHLINNILLKLNLNVCKGIKIDISNSVIIDDNIDKYNSSSKYYNDICSKTTSENNIDISLKDRRKEFIDNNLTLCEENCKLIDYNYDNKKAKCSCDIKIKIPLLKDIKFNKDDLYKSFTDIKNIININVIKCFKYVFNKSIKNNYGFYILLVIIILFFVCIFIFYKKSFYKIKNNINYFAIFKTTKGNIIYVKKILPRKKETSNSNLNLNLNFNNIISKRNLNNKNIAITNNNDENNKIEVKNETINKNNIQYEDFELNSLEYKEALKFDKRSFIQCYISLLRNNHLLIFSFFDNKDYNSRIIKMFLFFFFLGLHININALFFNDETLHKIYLDKGSYNFIYQIPQILYSSILSGIIGSIIKYLSLISDDISKLKNDKDKNNIDKKKEELVNKIKIKFYLFFIITFIILLFIWCCLVCFCGVFINTQTHLIKDSIISFVVGLLYPFVIYLIPAILRTYTLKSDKSEKCSFELLYKLSDTIQPLI